MAHNALRAHGRAVQMLRAYAKQPIEVGFAPTCGMCYPESEKPEDIEAARQMMFSMSLQPADNWTWNVAWWSDPVLLGHFKCITKRCLYAWCMLTAKIAKTNKTLRLI